MSQSTRHLNRSQTSLAAEDSHCDEQQIARALKIFTERGKPFELRAIGSGRDNRKITSGYFNDIDAAVQAALDLEASKAKGIYVVMNCINPALFARSPNCLTDKPEATTSDLDITRRRWLLLDFDVKRPSGVSSSDAEHRAAETVARECRDYLSDAGWPEPIVADSGNGWHLVYAIDLPNDADSTELVKRVCETLADAFDNDSVVVDRKVFNAARIWKLYGTTARKGHDTADRPWRMAKLDHIPAEIEEVTTEQLTQVTSNRRPPQAQEERASWSGQRLDVPEWLTSHGVEFSIKNGADSMGRTVYLLKHCPFNSDHGNHGEVAIFQWPDGKLGASCQHSSCSGKTWQDFKAAIGAPPRTSSSDCEHTSNTLGHLSQKRAEVRRRHFAGNTVKHGITMASPSPTVSKSSPYPTGSFPEPISSFIRETSSSIEVDESAVGTMILPCLAGVIGNSSTIRVTPQYAEPAILWGVLIGDSGSRKTPAFKAVAAGIEEEEHRLSREHQEDMQQFNASHAEREKPPVRHEVYCSDVTIEALAPVLEKNERGVILLREELAQWLGGMNQYKKGGADESAWCEMFGASPIKVNRKTGESKIIYVPRAAVSVAGTITPGTMRARLGQANWENGLAPRLLMAMPEDRARKECGTPIAETAHDMRDVFSALYSLPLIHDDEGRIKPCEYTFSAEAKKVRRNFFAEMEKRRVAAEDGSAKAILSKLQGIQARIALVLHLAAIATGYRTRASKTQIGLDTAAAAVALANWYADENLRICGVLGEDEEEKVLRLVLEWIIKQGRPVTARDIERGPAFLRKNGGTILWALTTLARRKKLQVRQEKAKNGVVVDHYSVTPFAE